MDKTDYLPILAYGSFLRRCLKENSSPVTCKKVACIKIKMKRLCHIFLVGEYDSQQKKNVLSE